MQSERSFLQNRVNKNAVQLENLDKIYGDVDFENVKDIATITPVPGGVGPMTVTMLLYNTVKNYKENQKKLVLK